MATVDEALGTPRQTVTALQKPTDEEKFSSGPWPIMLRIAFRFAFSFLVIYDLPFPLDISAGAGGGLFPGANYLVREYTRMWHAFVPWTGAHILHLSRPIAYFPTGSGDTTSDWVQFLCFVVFAAIATLAWTLLDRRHKQYRTLHEWLRIYVRYALAFTMFGYGFAKLPHGQFRTPGLDRLIEPYGSFTPMGTLWYFMGVSWVYTLFGGIVEVTGGFLLLFRRTATLGALVVFGAMLNVVMLNYTYDVPVKLYSTILLLMAVFLLAPDLRRLIRFFLLNRSTVASRIAFPLNGRWVKPARLVLKTLIVLLALYGTLGLRVRRMLSAPSMEAKSKSPLYGIYNVEGTGQDAPGAGISDTVATNWRRLAFDYRSSMAVVMADDSMPRYRTQFDTARHTVTLSTYDGGKTIGVLSYSRRDADHLILRGAFNGKPADINLRKIDASKYRLFNTGYHWINEFSNDR